MSIPGLSQYPDLEERYKRKLAEVRRGRNRCANCEINKITESFRRQLHLRLERDKKPRRS